MAEVRLKSVFNDDLSPTKKKGDSPLFLFHAKLGNRIEKIINEKPHTQHWGFQNFLTTS